MTDFTITHEIDLDLLETIHGGAGKRPATETPAKPENLGTDAVSGCFTGIGGSLGKAKNPRDIAVGCALGAGKSIFEGLGKMFGGGSKKAAR
jgi:hypothetical protein